MANYGTSLHSSAGLGNGTRSAYSRGGGEYGRATWSGESETRITIEDITPGPYGDLETTIDINPGDGRGNREYAYGSVWGDGSSDLDEIESHWYFNYIRAKSEGVPEHVLDIELVEDPTLSRYKVIK